MHRAPCFILLMLFVLAVVAQAKQLVMQGAYRLTPQRARNLANWDGEEEGREDLPPYMQFEFQSQGRVFIFWLQRKHGLVGSGSRVVVHADGHREQTGGINGRPYLCTRLIIYGGDPRHQDGHKVKVEYDQKNPGGRFYAYRTPSGELYIRGGFHWNGQFYQVKRPAVEKGDDDSKAAPLKSRRASGQLALYRHDEEDSGTRYGCGHDRLRHNRVAQAQKLIRSLVHPPQSHSHPHQSHSQPAIMKMKQGNDANTLSIEEMLAKSVEDVGKGEVAFAGRTGCPTTRKSLYVAAVADCGYMREYGGSREEAQAAIISDFNLASEVFERQFNIELGLTDIHLMEACRSPNEEDPRTRWNDQCSRVPSMEERLSLFSAWQPTLNLSALVGVVHLLTGCVESEVVGIAWLDQVCQREPVRKSGASGSKGRGGEVVAGTSISALVPNQHAVILHELGHSLGAIHDCELETCRACDVQRPDTCACCACGPVCDCRGRHVMSPESGGRNVTTFSTCSYGDICRKLPVLAQRCLHDPGRLRTLNDGGVCGDGIKDPGEECDCGTNCDRDACCTPECKLRQGAKCSDANDQCCRGCHLKPRGDVCRLALDSCQEDGICDGASPECPRSIFKNDTTSCTYAETGEAHDLKGTPHSGNMHCASGICTNRDLQCMAIGRRLRIVGACAFLPNACRLVCQRQDGKCVGVDANFLDGTKCGEQGHCVRGVCTEGEWLGYLRRNRYFLIGFGIAVLLVGLLLLVVVRNRAKSLQQQSTDARTMIAASAAVGYPAVASDSRSLST
jgi:hypothetical protein